MIKKRPYELLPGDLIVRETYRRIEFSLRESSKRQERCDMSSLVVQVGEDEAIAYDMIDCELCHIDMYNTDVDFYVVVSHVEMD